MIDQALWALGRGTGITALAFMTVALFLGIATRSGRPLLMLPRFAVADVHRFASLVGTLLVVLHMALLFFDPYAQLRLVDFIVPFLGLPTALARVGDARLRPAGGGNGHQSAAPPAWRAGLPHGALVDLCRVAGSHGARTRERH